MTTSSKNYAQHIIGVYDTITGEFYGPSAAYKVKLIYEDGKWRESLLGHPVLVYLVQFELNLIGGNVEDVTVSLIELGELVNGHPTINDVAARKVVIKLGVQE